MPSGNGAYIVHAELSTMLPGYQIQACNPYLASIPGLPSRKLRHWLGDAEVVHLSPSTGHVPLPPVRRRVLTFHSFDIDPLDMEQASFAQRLYYKHVLRPATIAACTSADRIIAVSHYVADCVRRNDLAGHKQIDVIYNGIDTNRFRPIEGETKDRPLRILFVGNPSRRKGFHLLLDLAARLPRGVEIAFTSGLRNQRIDTQNPLLVSIGSVPHSAMHTLYQSADILLFPAYREGLPLCVAEAMSCGIPVVSSNCSGIREMIIDGSGGFLVPPGDSDALLEKIRLLTSDEGLRRSMGQRNRARAVQQFDRNRMARDYEAIFEGCL